MLKRGDMNFMMVMLIVVLALAAIVLVMVIRTGESTSAAIKQATPATLRSQISTCKISSSGFQDSIDSDKLADFCDPCLGGNDFQQSDNDFLADACDINKRSTDASPVLACCGKELSGDTPEKQIASCDSKRLVSIDPFQCCAIGAKC